MNRSELMEETEIANTQSAKQYAQKLMRKNNDGEWYEDK